jgi:hypothetical protein
MSKLFKLKKYYSIEEAAKYLANVFEEDVAVADIYRLGLDNHIRLSINFVNHAKVRKGKLIPKSEAKIRPFIFKDINLDGFETPDGQQVTLEMLASREGISFGDDYQLILDSSLSTVDDIWDLCMLANERIDIEYEYQRLTSGVEVTLVNWEGTYVEKYIDGERIISELQIRFSKEELEQMYGDNLPKYSSEKNYYPAAALPSDSPLIIRTSELSRLISSLMEDPELLEKPAAKQKEVRTPEPSLLDSLGILAYMLSESTPKFKWGENPNAKGIAEAIAQKAASLGVEVKELTNLQKDISIAVEKVAPRIKK